ncbi:MAG: ATP cone domain-containing protein [Bacteroidota bacterium]
MTEKKQILVKKASGKTVPFSEEKIRNSLQRSGAGENEIKEILNALWLQIYNGMPTKKIYRIAFSHLKKISKPVAARYHLKNAIMELGPAGFSFEKYIATILSLQGYSTKTGQKVRGKCVNHEVDVEAENDHHHFMIECKYHNQPGNVCDVKIPLYIHSRFKDVEEEWIKLPGHENKIHTGWVVTNTRFTSDAIQYGTCSGLKLTSWDFPDKFSLREQIDSLGLYPVTCLTTLTKEEKQHLLKNNIVLCRELCHDNDILYKMNIKPGRITSILNEGIDICHKMISSENH